MTANQAPQRAPTYRRDPEKKRADLAAAALHFFIAKGYEATSTAEIARRAGTSEGTLFNHFGSKRGLFEFLAEDYAKKSARMIAAGPQERLTVELVVRRAFDFCDAHKEQHRLFSLQYSAEKKKGVIIETIESGIKHGMSKGYVRLGNPRIMAELQFAIIEQSYNFWRLSNRQDLRETYIQEAMSAMNAALAPQLRRSSPNTSSNPITSSNPNMSSQKDSTS